MMERIAALVPRGEAYVVDRRRIPFAWHALALIVAVLIIASSTADGASLAPARLTDVAITRDDDTVRIDIRTTGSPRHRATWLPAGNRLVVDFEDTQYAPAAPPAESATDLVRHVRGSQFHKDARIVLELARPAPYTIDRRADGLSIVFALSQAPAAPGPAPNAGLGGDMKSTVDVEQLKRALDQIQVEPRAAAAVSPSAPPEQTVTVALRQAIDLALERNLGLQVAGLAKESARRGIDRARAIFHPTAGAALFASRERLILDRARQQTVTTFSAEPFIQQTFPTATSLILSGGLGGFAVSGSGEEYDTALSLTASQPLLRGGRTYVATQPLRNAEFDFRVSDERLKSQVLQVRAQTKAAYYGVLLGEKVIEATNAAIERDRLLIDASQALFRARLVTRRDVFSAELILAQDTARRASAQADLETARNVLLNILGLPIGTGVDLLDQEITFAPVTIELQRWIQSAVRQRPEIRALDEQLGKSALNVRVAANAVLPQLDLVASYGRTGNSPQVGRAALVGGDVWTAGLVFSMPIGNVAARAALAQAELEHTSLLKAREETERQIELEVRAAVIKLETSVQRMRALTVAIDQAKGKLEVGRAQFALGQATNLDITDAQQSLLNAETDLLTAIIDYKVGVAQLEAALGDGGDITF